jgi:DnaJ family protein C protein 11
MSSNSSSADSAPQEEQHSYYSILNVPRDANEEQIKRAYRSLAQSLHPDKHTDEGLRDNAQEAFRRLQEAYDVLKDPQKRAVYDVYGPEGLTAGLEVGSKLDGPEELRRKWEAFKAQQAKEAEDASVGHRAYYMCMLDAVKLVNGDITSVPMPRVIVVQNSVAVPVTPQDTLSIQGSAALRSQAGQGSVIAGYERTLTPRDTLSAQVVLGLQSLVTLTSTRQLGQYTSASLTGTYNPSQGLGLQLATSRQLALRTSAQFAWVVGPAAASGMVLSATHKGARYIVVAKLEVGVVTSISLRLTWLLNKVGQGEGLPAGSTHHRGRRMNGKDERQQQQQQPQLFGLQTGRQAAYLTMKMPSPIQHPQACISAGHGR